MGLAERLQEQALKFERLASFEVDQCGRLVSAHGSGADNLGLFELLVELGSKRASGSDDFADKFANEPFPIRVCEQFVRRKAGTEGAARLNLSGQESFLSRCARDTEAVEGDVPGELFPMGLGEIFGDAAGDTSVAKHCGDLVRARLRKASEFAEHHCAVVDVMNDAGLSAVQAHEAKAAEDLFWRDNFGQLLLVAEAVLQSNDCCGGADQRRNQFRQTVVCRGFQADQDQVSHADIFRMGGRLGVNVKIAIAAVDG